jgi:hypothetical protein
MRACWKAAARPNLALQRCRLHTKRPTWDRSTCRARATVLATSGTSRAAAAVVLLSRDRSSGDGGSTCASSSPSSAITLRVPLSLRASTTPAPTVLPPALLASLIAKGCEEARCIVGVSPASSAKPRAAPLAASLACSPSSSGSGCSSCRPDLWLEPPRERATGLGAPGPPLSSDGSRMDGCSNGRASPPPPWLSPSPSLSKDMDMDARDTRRRASATAAPAAAALPEGELRTEPAEPAATSADAAAPASSASVKCSGRFQGCGAGPRLRAVEPGVPGL